MFMITYFQLSKSTIQLAFKYELILGKKNLFILINGSICITIFMLFSNEKFLLNENLFMKNFKILTKKFQSAILFLKVDKSLFKISNQIRNWWNILWYYKLQNQIDVLVIDNATKTKKKKTKWKFPFWFNLV